MNALKEFVIPYLGLSDGTHKFSFDIDKTFFQQFEKSKIEEGKLNTEVDFIKSGRMIVLEIKGSGFFNALCDRCVAEIPVPLTFEDRIIIKLSEEVDVDNEDVVYIDDKSSHIDISPFIYESIHLHMPLQKLRDCESEEYKFCDEAALNNLGGSNQYDDNPGNDNPWKELKKFKFDKDN